MNKLSYSFELTNIPAPVEHVMGVWLFRRPPNFKHLCYSLSGHLLHLVTSGSYVVKINGVAYQVSKGDIIYYYETEEVETIGEESEVIFYSVSYLSGTLPPLALDQRVFQATRTTKKHFKRLYRAFSSGDPMRNLKVYAHLHNILHGIGNRQPDRTRTLNEGNLWWAVENRLRKHKRFRPALDELTDIAGYSASTLTRVCKQSTGDTPIARMRKIRMEEARSLLSFSDLNVTQVSEYLSYPRVNEFSRDFADYFGVTPSSVTGKQFTYP